MSKTSITVIFHGEVFDLIPHCEVCDVLVQSVFALSDWNVVCLSASHDHSLDCFLVEYNCLTFFFQQTSIDAKKIRRNSYLAICIAIHKFALIR